jgi:acyl-coenzyme A thioesterase PaaI-like protein
MRTADAVLRGGIEPRSPAGTLRLDPAFQGLPDTAHGGTVLAAFDVVAALEGPRQVRGLYRRRVPVGVPLDLRTWREDGALRSQLADRSGAVLVEGTVTPGLAPPGPAGPTLPGTGAAPLPISSTCFACGVDNPLGLRVQLFADHAIVGATWRPPPTCATPSGGVAPVAITALLDEAAFWLGALATGESGLTTELLVTLRAPAAFGPALIVSGDRTSVRPRVEDPRYWSTEVAVWDEARRCVADARITFVAVRGAARRLAAWLCRANPREVVRRVFPGYV